MRKKEGGRSKIFLSACFIFVLGFLFFAIWNVLLVEEIRGAKTKREQLEKDIGRLEILEKENRAFLKDVLKQRAMAYCFWELIGKYESKYNLGKIQECIQLLEVTDGKYRDIGLDAPLIFAWIEKESAGNPDAVSYAGAKGIVQLMDFRAEEILTDMGYAGFDIELVFDPVINLEGGIRHLWDLMNFWGRSGIKNHNLVLFYALHSYKWGSNNTLQLFNSPKRAYRPAIEYVNWILNRREYWVNKMNNFVGTPMALTESLADQETI